MHDAAKKKILIVDDQTAVVRVITAQLESAGFLVHCAFTGKEAVAAVREAKPDLVILDIHLKDAGGLGVLKAIKKNHPALPVLLMTGLYDPKEAQQAAGAGALDYLSKPIDFDQLKEILHRRLGGSPS